MENVEQHEEPPALTVENRGEKTEHNEYSDSDYLGREGGPSRQNLERPQVINQAEEVVSDSKNGNDNKDEKQMLSPKMLENLPLKKT